MEKACGSGIRGMRNPARRHGRQLSARFVLAII
jgi:hypothetical protein